MLIVAEAAVPEEGLLIVGGKNPRFGMVSKECLRMPMSGIYRHQAYTLSLLFI